MAEGMRPTVLVVDDDPSLRMLCRINLELDGYRVVEAASIAEARTALEREPVAAMLLDVHVGHGDGRDLLRELRAEGAVPPVALLTGSVSIEEADRGLADAVLGKPFGLDELTQTVARLARQPSQVDSPE
jgi:DNA-binding response OmpR family regulator